jgi:calcium-dependent protein kinase
VRVATPLRGNVEAEVAIKSVAKDKIRNDLYFLKRELDILMLVDHPNIIKFYESYEDDRYIHMVQELCTGGDLLDRLAYASPISEESLSQLCKKILSAVNHLHSLYICHRDIKPENFLFKSKDPSAEIKLIDFGMSVKFGKGAEELSTMVGTPNYLAPEVLTAHYGKECDVWSLGVTLYYILSGHLPFEAATLAATFYKVSQGEFDFSGEEWDEYSSDVKDLISRMLVADPTRRITLPTAFHHKWFSSHQSSRRSSIEIPRSVLSSLRKYKPPAKLQGEAMKVMVKHLSAKDIEELDRVFKALDKDSTGFITRDSLEKAMLKSGLNLIPSELLGRRYVELLESLSSLQQGGIKYSTFLMATLDRRKFLDEEIMYMAFKHMDTDNDGFITVRDLKGIMEAAGEQLSVVELEAMISEFAQDGRVGFAEFRTMMEAFESEAPVLSVRGSSPGSRRSSVMQRLSVISEPFS